MNKNDFWRRCFLINMVLQKVAPSCMLHAFLENLKQVVLPFDLTAQTRKKDHPGFPGFECGLPPEYYYFVPGTGYGGHRPFPEDPIDPRFVSAVDGIGLNFRITFKAQTCCRSIVGTTSGASEGRKRWSRGSDKASRNCRGTHLGRHLGSTCCRFSAPVGRKKILRLEHSVPRPSPESRM